MFLLFSFLKVRISSLLYIKIPKIFIDSSQTIQLNIGNPSGLTRFPGESV